MKTLYSYIQIPLFFIISICSMPLEGSLSEEKAIKKLKSIHSQLSLVYGSLQEEYPEQVMATMFLKKNDRVLEIGGNVGRNSCVISSLLKTSTNLVVLETDPEIAAKLKANRNHNHLFFHIENSAISHVPLIQSSWVSCPSSILTAGYFKVNTLTYEELKNKYKIPFNVLVADCEGALYYILKDDESILEDVNLIITENDYLSREEYENVREKFIEHGFTLVYNAGGGWGHCADEFYQVWAKSSR